MNVQDTLQTTAKEKVQIIAIGITQIIDPKTTQKTKHIIETITTNLEKTTINLDLGIIAIKIQTPNPTGINNTENLELQLNKIHCESPYEKSENESTSVINMKKVENEYKTPINSNQCQNEYLNSKFDESCTDQTTKINSIAHNHIDTNKIYQI